jgi:hypothetical protein
VTETLPVLRSLFPSNNLRAMPRWLIVLGFGGSILAFACDDQTVEEVDKEVCYSGMRWVGDKRGSPEMFPGRDCVGCHIDNDGPPLALGGTIYSYVLGAPTIFDAQSGEDCFGIEGIQVTIEDGEGQIFELTTNRAGNFFVEGNPDDFAKPFSARIDWINGDGLPKTNEMFRAPSYGGCGRCHNPSAEQFPPRDAEPGTFEPGTFPEDVIIAPAPRIGRVRYSPGDDGFVTIEEELEAIAERNAGASEDE